MPENPRKLPHAFASQYFQVQSFPKPIDNVSGNCVNQKLYVVNCNHYSFFGLTEGLGEVNRTHASSERALGVLDNAKHTWVEMGDGRKDRLVTITVLNTGHEDTLQWEAKYVSSHVTGEKVERWVWFRAWTP